MAREMVCSEVQTLNGISQSEKNPTDGELIMPRIPALAPESVSGKVNEMLDLVDRKLGMVPNMMRTMANSPAVLDGSRR
jgi:hypothetical protein